MSGDTDTGSGNVLSNDSDVDDGATLTVDSGSTGASLAGTYGTLNLAADGSYTYTLNTAGVQHLAEGASVSDSFGYKANDEHGALSNTATLTITITGVNDAPVAADDAKSMTEDTATVSGNVLTNDTDVDDGATLTVDSGSPGASLSGSYGTLNLAADGSYTYTLNTTVLPYSTLFRSVSDSFGYKASDEHGALSNTATLTITITGVNDA